MPSLTLSTPSFQSVCASYFQLCKPKVVSLIAFTALVGILLASNQDTQWGLALVALIGISLAAAAGAAVNHYVDARIDALMSRTKNRPLPSGALHPASALVFAGVLAAIAMYLLAVYVNLLTAWLTFFSMIGYAVVYTVFLKRRTPHNIVLGGAAGAMPPLLGWTAITGAVSTEAIVLFLIIFIWTPPHFWALAIKRRKEYAKADIPMLPVTHGVHFTKQQILIYTLMLFAISLLPFVIKMSGIIYLAGAVPIGFGFIWHAYQLYRASDDRLAGPTFGYSIYYLFLLFLFLLLDHYIGGYLRESLLLTPWQFKYL